MRDRRSRLLFGMTGIILLVVGASGCDDKRRHQASDSVGIAEVAPPVPKDANPEIVGRAFLTALCDAQQVRGRGFGTPERKHDYDNAMGRIVSLTARRAVYEKLLRFGARIVPADLTEETAAVLMAESWVSVVAHYSGGIQLDTLRVNPQNPDPAREARVFVIAERPDDRAKLSEIETSLGVAREDSQAPVEGSDAEATQVRSKALAQGLNPPINVQLDLRLVHEEGAWHVAGVRLGPIPEWWGKDTPREPRAFPIPRPASRG